MSTPTRRKAASAAKPATPTTPAEQPKAQTPQQPQAHHKQGRRQQKVGRVVSDKMQKTIVVAVESLKRHPIYKRTYKSTTKFKAHDEENAAHINDMVRIEETRPLSKDKRWRLVEIIKQAVQTTPVEEVVEQLAPEILSAEDANETDDEDEE